MKISNHTHREFALHSPEQQRMFFGVAKTLGYPAKEVKERAIKHFQKDCFNDLTTSNLIYLIDKLVEKTMEKFKSEA